MRLDPHAGRLGLCFVGQGWRVSAHRVLLGDHERGASKRAMILKGFQTFLETIRCWLRKATDAEVETLYTLVSAERTQRAGLLLRDAAPPAADQPPASDPADRDPPAGH